MDFWDSLYSVLGIKGFIYYISSSAVQDYLFPVKLVFLMFGVFFFCGVIYYMINSSWLQYKFLENASEFFSWQSYGARQIAKQWEKIKKRLESGSEADYKLSIIEADDFFRSVLDDHGFDDEDFAVALKQASSLLKETSAEAQSAHEVRNKIVYEPDFNLSREQTERVLDAYYRGISAVGLR